MKPIIIHTHFHKRRTGVTRSVENVIPFLKKLFKTYLYGYGVIGDKISFFFLGKILFSSKEVVIHCHRNNEIVRMLLFRALGAKFKLIATRHAETKPSGLTQFLLGKSDKVITLTKSMSSSLGIKNTIVAHGVDTGVFKPKENTRLKGIQQSEIILCAGRVRESKGHIVLTEAVIPILKENRNLALVIVGKVDKSVFLEKLKLIVSENLVEEQVYFIEETSDIVSYYQAAKIAVVPSFSEGFSLVCAEAMSCGCTVVATSNVGVHSDLISNRESGYLFEPGDKTALKNILFQLAKKELPLLGDSARAVIVNNWSAKKEAEELIKVYLS